MLKNFITLILVSFVIVSCKKNNTSFNAKQMEESKYAEIGVVSNIIGTNIYNEEALSSKKIGTLKYAEKISVINFDENQNLIKIKFKEKDAYISKSDIEIISSELYKKSYFSKDCYCLLGSDKIQTINFPTQYDTVKYLFKNNQLRTIQQILYYRPGSDSYVESEYDVKNNIKDSDFYSFFLSMDKNNFFNGEIFYPEKNEIYLNCFNSKSTYKIGGNKNILSDIQYNMDDSNYAENLFNIDVCYAKIDYTDFVRPLLNFDFKSQNLIIEQDKAQINKNVPIHLFEIDTYKPIAYNENYVSFNYLREIKVVKKDGKKRYFAKINVLESFDSEITGEYYIDLKEVAMFASIPD